MTIYNILNLGAGVQSSTLLLLMCQGKLPKPDCAVFADTGWEPRAVYEHLTWIKGEATAAGIRVHAVSAGNIRVDVLAGMALGGRSGGGKRFASMPFFTFDDAANKGQSRRQCTKEYKIEPIEQFIRRELVGLKPRQRMPLDATIRQWYGISADEWHRAKAATARWEERVWPFLLIGDDSLGVEWKRQDCIDWLETQYPERTVPRSACIGCPYHSDAEWRRMRDEDPDSWSDAVEFDKAIRHCIGMRGEVYLHRSCKALDEVDLRTDVEKGQGLLWNGECEGMCGV